MVLMYQFDNEISGRGFVQLRASFDLGGEFRTFDVTGDSAAGLRRNERGYEVARPTASRRCRETITAVRSRSSRESNAIAPAVHLPLAEWMR